MTALTAYSAYKADKAKPTPNNDRPRAPSLVLITEYHSTVKSKTNQKL